MLEFGWDERKNRSNQKKHGIWFEEAQSVFDDALARLFEDDSSSGEPRFFLIGQSFDRRLLVVVHCYRESDTLVRIISARQATNKERIFMKKEYDFSKMKAVKNPYADMKKAVGINLSHQVIDYFKQLSAESGIPYQKLIDLYLLDCVQKKRKLSMKWTG